MSTTCPSLPLIRRCVGAAFPDRRIEEAKLLSGGLSNTNLKVSFRSGEEAVVLRLNRRGANTCLKEIEALRLVRQTVPVPEVFHVDPNGIDGSGPFSVIQFVEGLTFQQLKRTGNLTAIHEASSSVGKTLAAIGGYQFSKPGRLFATPKNQLEVGAPYTKSSDPIPEILDSFLDSKEVQHRLGAPLVDGVHNLVWAWAPSLPDITEVSQLVHSDFGNRNILVNEINGQWKVAAVLDWEFAFSGSALMDVGNFLRYETAHEPLREPHFSRSFVEHGGKLPDGWRQIIRILDLGALVECLTHNYLPDDVANEIIGLINSTLDECKV
jgi:aminoglycoside phosphotransferase (APT) family kinase protein